MPSPAHAHAQPTDAATLLTLPYNAVLALANGEVFYGYGVGKAGTTAGELCFNTSLTGYQEILTDPSYAGQIITFTFPHIGNVGTNAEDVEADAPHARGLVMRESITEPANFRAGQRLHDWLAAQGLTGISGVDTRRLTRSLRTHGAQEAVIWFGSHIKDADVNALVAQAKAHPSLKGLDLAKDVSRSAQGGWEESLWVLGHGYGTGVGKGKHIVAVDYGVKRNILRNFAELGCKITVVPAQSTAEQILSLKPDAVFLSNGPGDPAATGAYAVPMIQALLAKDVPIFGICLGHQMLAIALGCQTEKMKQGHRGANHPVKELATGRVFITSQNHGFVVSDAHLPDGVEVTHRSLFDGTVQGIAVKDKCVFSVQGHPEASPGPHDTLVLFQQFLDRMAD